MHNPIAELEAWMAYFDWERAQNVDKPEPRPPSVAEKLQAWFDTANRRAGRSA